MVEHIRRCATPFRAASSEGRRPAVFRTGSGVSAEKTNQLVDGGALTVTDILVVDVDGGTLRHHPSGQRPP
ncbi:MAG: hypothetical protein OXN84_08355, partial [Albidovulum sp.]|nr:hypothetical protein [Albidovulum sp.]